MEELGDRALGDFISVSEAMERAGYTRAYVIRLVREGRVEGVKLANNWLVYWPSLEHYMSHRRGPGRPGKRLAKPINE